jgi:hypothetical protein
MRKKQWTTSALMFFLSLFLLLSTLSSCSTAIDEDPINDEDPVDDPVEDPDDEVVKVEDLTFFPRNPIEPVMDVKS